MFAVMNELLARERYREMREKAERAQLMARRQTPVTRVTLRHAVAADAQRLRDLADLDSAKPLPGSALVAEVDGRLRAALSLDAGCAIADPFYNGQQLLELLRLRARQLGGR